MKKNLIIDFYNLAFRTIYTSMKQGKNEYMINSEIYNYFKHLSIQSIMAEVDKVDYDNVIIAYDNRSGYWRHQIYPAYKANRKVAREKSELDFQEFGPILDSFIKEFTELFPMFHHLQIPLAEADDIAAVLAKELSTNPSLGKADYTKIITSDKDYIQLLKYEGVEIYNPITRKKRTCMNIDKDLKIKCVMGDRGDNIFAVKERTGIAKATKMVEEGTIDDIMLKFFQNPDNMIEEELTIARKMKLNTELISFEHIPLDLANEIKVKFHTYVHPKFDQGKLIKYCSQNEMAKLSTRFLKGGTRSLYKIQGRRDAAPNDELF